MPFRRNIFIVKKKKKHRNRTADRVDNDPIIYTDNKNLYKSFALAKLCNTVLYDPRNRHLNAETDVDENIETNSVTIGKYPILTRTAVFFYFRSRQIRMLAGRRLGWHREIPKKKKKRHIVGGR